jgi:hypothetical protein
MAVASWAGRLLTWQRDLAALKDVVAQVFGRREERASQ